MNFIKKLFDQSKIQCPRCLGKGHVDWDDIKRLNKELKWIPGKCAYCNGGGNVGSNMVSQVPVDTTYLSINLSEEERIRLIHQEQGAWARAQQHEDKVDGFLKQVVYLHKTGNLNATQIADFYLISAKEDNALAKEKQELVEYIERILHYGR